MKKIMKVLRPIEFGIIAQRQNNAGGFAGNTREIISKQRIIGIPWAIGGVDILLGSFAEQHLIDFMGLLVIGFDQPFDAALRNGINFIPASLFVGSALLSDHVGNR